MPIDITKLEADLDKNDLESVRAQIRAVAAEKLSDRDSGKSLVDFAELYLDVVNSVNERYKALLEETILGMQKLNKSESKMNDAAQAKAVRNQLNNIGAAN